MEQVLTPEQAKALHACATQMLAVNRAFRIETTAGWPCLIFRLHRHGMVTVDIQRKARVAAYESHASLEDFARAYNLEPNK